MYVFGVPAPVAVGSALCRKCGTSIASFVEYRALGRGEPRIDLVMMGGSVIGVDAGTRLLHRLAQAGTLRGAGGRAVPLVDAAGTGILLLFATVVVGTVEQALRGVVSLELAMAILVDSSVGSQLGALTTHGLPNRTLRLAFAVLVMATLAMIPWDLARLLR